MPDTDANRLAGLLDKVCTFSQLDRLKELPVDWNGYGAQAIDTELIEQAKRVVEQLPDDIIDTPVVVPRTRGRFQFEWHRGNRSLELEFESRGRLHYLKADDDSGIDQEAILLTHQTSEIEELLRWFSSESDVMTPFEETQLKRRHHQAMGYCDDAIAARRERHFEQATAWSPPRKKMEKPCASYTSKRLKSHSVTFRSRTSSDRPANHG